MSAQCNLVALRQSASAPVRRHASALADVVDYVSDRLGELGAALHEPWFSAQSGRLQLLGDNVEAEVGPFLIRSDSTPLFRVANPTLPAAWASTVKVRTRSGLPVSAEALMRLQTTHNAVIALDRLCRVLHMLNHLLQAREALDLWVPLGLRHLLAIDAGHGAFFEEVLHRCGLGADRIVLLIAPGGLNDTEWSHLQSACATYRERGFRLGVSLDERFAERDAGHLAAMAPDWLCGEPARVLPLRAGLPATGVCIDADAWPQAPGEGLASDRDLLRLPMDRRLSFLL